MSKTAEKLAAVLAIMLSEKEICINDVEDVLNETLSIFKAIPLNIPKRRSNEKRNKESC